MKPLKIRKIGNSLGVVLPKEALAELRLEEGDELTVVTTKDGLRLDIYDADVADQVKQGRDIARRYRNTLRELAK